MRQISVLSGGFAHNRGASVRNTKHMEKKDRIGMTERSRRESLVLGVIAGAVIAIGVIVPIIALSV